MYSKQLNLIYYLLLDQSNNIPAEHIREAINYRILTGRGGLDNDANQIGDLIWPSSHAGLASHASLAVMPSCPHAVTPFLTTEYHWVYTEFHGFKIICNLRNLRDQREPKLSHNLAATLRPIAPSYLRTIAPSYHHTFVPSRLSSIAPLRHYFYIHFITFLNFD
jgi:hypothetical protein